MRLSIMLIYIAVLLWLGCSPTTVYVKSGQAVRLRETISGVKVWVNTQSNGITPSVMNIPEGWYCLPEED